MITNWESSMAMGKSSMDFSIATFDYRRVSNILKPCKPVFAGGQPVASDIVKIIQDHKDHL